MKKIIAKTAITSVISQLAKPFLSLVTLPPLLSYLGQSGLGIWFIANSLASIGNILNLGVSTTLVTDIARIRNSERSELLTPKISSTLSVSALYAILFLAITVPLAKILNWHDILHISGQAESKDVEKMILTVAVATSVNFIAALPSQVIIGLQFGYVTHLITIAASLISTIAVFIAISLKLPIWIICGAQLTTNLLISFVASIIFLKMKKIKLFSLEKVNRSSFNDSIRRSSRMVIYQGAYNISAQSDQFIIGAILSPEAGVPYGIAARIFSFPLMITTAIVYATWPILANFDAQGKKEEFAKLFKRTLSLCFFVSAAAPLLIFNNYGAIVYTWLGKNIQTQKLIIIGMITWVFVGSIANVFDIALRAQNKTEYLMRSMVWMSIINLISTLMLIPRIGAAGAIWGTVAGYLIAILVPYGIKLKRLII